MCWRSSYQEGRAGIQSSRGGAGIQLSRREGWDTVIKRRGLGYCKQDIISHDETINLFSIKDII
jgi:hypothetical protein